MEGPSVRFDANIWIIRCSGRVQVWKINCWISRPTTTTIAPITHGKGERRIRPRHTPSQICARFAGNLWLANCYFAHNSLEFPVLLRFCDARSGRLFFHFIATLARLLRLGPGGARSLVAERFLLYARSPWTQTPNEI